MRITNISSIYRSMPSFFAIGVILFSVGALLSGSLRSTTIHSDPLRSVGWVQMSDHAREEYELDLQTLKSELQLRPDQNTDWAHVESALNESYHEFLIIPSQLFAEKRSLMERIDLVTAANRDSEPIMRLCAAIKKLFGALDERQRIVLDRRVLSVDPVARR